jgi:hypothetical protein
MDNDEILCDYVPCPAKDCTAIVVPGASERNRYDGEAVRDANINFISQNPNSRRTIYRCGE